MNQKWMPLAVFAGFCVVAVAVYFGLRSQSIGPESKPELVDLTLPEDKPREWVAAPSDIPAPQVDPAFAGTGDSGADPKVVRHTGVFKTAWMKHREEVARLCRVKNYETLDENWHFELPLELKINPQGVVIAARRFAKFREIGHDGEFHDAQLEKKAEDFLTECYTRAITERVRFPRAAQTSQLKVWVRMVSTVD